MDVSSLYSRFSSSRTPGPTPPSPQARVGAHVVREQNDVGFKQRLEKHLDDVQKGKGYISRDVGATVRGKEIGLANGLDAKTARDLYLYVGMFSYDKRARMVNAIKDYREDMAPLIGDASPHIA